ncbi:hypothetical protein [Parvibaculum sp.]|uniref:hypothetical protein n=1 Tax=Parvibaculum sp. TaxID=2024848 RepID=UPI001D989E43|nr:hypothetical protein [Parvibaculum sp.]MBX3490907.1 hypothetical protein [Parvibaculum sp.]
MTGKTYGRGRGAQVEGSAEKSSGDFEPLPEVGSEENPEPLQELVSEPKAVSGLAIKVSELQLSVPEVAALLVKAITDARAAGQTVQMPFRIEDLGRIAVSDTAKTR